MSVAFDDTESSPQSPAWKAVVGWALIAAAFLIAVTMGLKANNAYAAGQQVGNLLCVWLVSALVAWAATHKRAPEAKANARIVVGTVLLLTTFIGIVNGNAKAVREKEVGNKFLQDAVAMNQAHEKRFELLADRRAKTDIVTVLAVENMTSKAGIASSRAKVAEYRGQIAERGAVLKMNMEEAQSLVHNLRPSEFKTGAEVGAKKKIKEAAGLFVDIDRAELAQLAQVEKILDWCEAQGSKIRQEHGQLRLASQAQRSQLQTLIDELKRLDLDVENANKALQKKAADLVHKQAESLKSAKEFLEN